MSYNIHLISPPYFNNSFKKIWHIYWSIHNFYKTDWCVTRNASALSFASFHKYLDREKKRM